MSEKSLSSHDNQSHFSRSSRDKCTRQVFGYADFACLLAASWAGSIARLILARRRDAEVTTLAWMGEMASRTKVIFCKIFERT